MCIGTGEVNIRNGAVAQRPGQIRKKLFLEMEGVGRSMAEDDGPWRRSGVGNKVVDRGWDVESLGDYVVCILWEIWLTRFLEVRSSRNSHLYLQGLLKRGLLDGERGE
jgi:hypothetical protein